jgi:probable phosphoglycerate mutase
VGELLLIRHGETEWTLSRRHTSYTDLPLTANGEDQARAVAGALARHTIALALTSPLQRARRTAELAGLRHAQVEPNLREWDYGSYEGLTTPEIRSMRPGWVLWTHGAAAGADDHPGESPVQVGLRADRVLARIRRVLRDSPLGAVVLVAHGHFLRVLAARWLGLAPTAGAMFRLGTGTVSTLGTEHGRPVVSTWNMTPPPAVPRVYAAAADARRSELPTVLALGARSGDGGDLRLPACGQSPAAGRGRVNAGPLRIRRHSVLCKSSRYAKNPLRLLTLPPAPAARAGSEGLRSLAGFA